ncbi:hypothetical protein ERJ75_000911100 [Trypanosoma vivax]|nr:hypothetical protein ERJ75_000911100 [Trypanosoma vivax]
MPDRPPGDSRHGRTVVIGHHVVQRLRGLRLEVRTEPHSDHYWITFDAFVGTSWTRLLPPNARAPHAWNKARWHEFRKLSDEFIFRGMVRSAKAADALSDAVTRGIRMAAKRTFPKGKGWHRLLDAGVAKLDVAVQEARTSGSGMR